MKISIVCSKLSSNGIARAWILAQLLSRHYEVEALGWLQPGETVWGGFADYPWIPIYADTPREAMAGIQRAVTGDVMLAYGIGVLTFGAGILIKRRRRIPLILDMPEWEVWDHLNRRSAARRAMFIGRSLLGEGWSNPHSFKYRYVLDHLTWLADERLVCCEFLRNRYGGVVLPQGTDTAHFDPARFDKPALRRKWNLPQDATLVFFGGNPMPNKGLTETVAALNALDGRVDSRLVIAGRADDHPYVRGLIEQGRGKVIVQGVQPFSAMPELLATSDLVVLHHQRDAKSRGYVPCKLYEAMAMGIPVISAAHSDVPKILDGCGYLVESDEPAALQAKIEYVLTHADEAAERGRRARQRVIDRYSWTVMDGILRDVVEGVRSSNGRNHAATRH
jgi:glycosyltransferase involved in cell wall biosynthesis